LAEITAADAAHEDVPGRAVAFLASAVQSKSVSVSKLEQAGSQQQKASQAFSVRSHAHEVRPVVTKPPELSGSPAARPERGEFKRERAALRASERARGSARVAQSGK
jgi:hypothetical protein